MRYIEINKLPKPINYGNKKNSSGVGFELEVYLYLRKYYPNDLKKILSVFPLSEKILFDYDNKRKQEVHTK